MDKNLKGFATLLVILVFALITIIGIGYYSWQKGLIKTTPNQESSPTPTPDETANWKTYVNEDNKFSFKYPVNAGVTKSKVGATIVIPGDKPMFETMESGFINITFESLPIDIPRNNLPLNELVENEFNSIKPENAEILSESTEITLNGYRGYTYSSRDKIAFGFDTKYIYLESNNNDYVIIVITFDDPDNLGYEKTIDQILSTFKFLE